ncbi:TolC family protein, partial [Acinetobacter baumannii]|nr:TolC family protein [Acinetobacter baumannii]
NGLVVSPLFNMGKNRAALKSQKAVLEAETATYEKAVLNAFKEARNAIVDFNKIKEVYELRVKLERSAKNYVELAQLQYIN